MKLLVWIMDVKEKIKKILDDDINLKLVLHGGGADVVVDDSISDDLLDFARQILAGRR